MRGFRVFRAMKDLIKAAREYVKSEREYRAALLKGEATIGKCLKAEKAEKKFIKVIDKYAPQVRKRGRSRDNQSKAVTIHAK